MSRMVQQKKVAAKKATQKVAKKPVRRARPEPEEVEEAPSRPAKRRGARTSYLIVRALGISTVEGSLVSKGPSIVTVAHRNRMRPGLTAAMRRAPSKAIERGISPLGPRHFEISIPTQNIVSMIENGDNIVVAYKTEIVVDRIKVTGEVTAIQGGFLKIGTDIGDVIVPASLADIVTEITGGSRGEKQAAQQPTKGKVGKKKPVVEEDDEEATEDDDTPEDEEEDSAAPDDDGETTDDGEDDDEAGSDDDEEDSGKSSDDDW